MTGNDTTHIEIPPKGDVGPALTFVSSYAEGLGVEAERREYLKNAFAVALGMVKENHSECESKIGIDIFENEGSLVVEVLNRGVPIFLNAEGQAMGERFHEASRHLDRVAIENRGRQGQSFVLGMRLGQQAAMRSFPGELASNFRVSDAAAVDIRPLEAGEESKLSQLFYSVYGYDYIHEFVYYPEKIKTMVQEGRLISMVGVLPGGKLVGHIGLMRWSDNPVVFEPCLGVVDPRLKSRGLFGNIFRATMERVGELSMHYCFFDFVTNHEISQKFIAKYNPCDLALFVGCQTKATQARLEKLGMGEDPKETDRYTLLYSVLPRVSQPFGKEVYLPNNLGEMLGFLLRPLNLSWSPASRFQVLARVGQYQIQLQPAQNSVVFDFAEPGREAAHRMVKEWTELLKNGYEYAAVDVPLSKPGLGNVYDILSDQGFFVAGFVPYRMSDQLGIRFQALGHSKVAFEEIRVYSPTAKQLLEVVQKNFERNRLQ